MTKRKDPSVSHSMSAIVRKLSLLKGREQALTDDISDLRKARTATRSQVQVLEDAIRILEPGFDLSTVVASREHFVMFRRGELGKLCLEALKDAPAPLRHIDAARAVAESIGKPSVAHSIVKKVRIALYGLRKRGLVETVGRKNAPGVTWRIARPRTGAMPVVAKSSTTEQRPPLKAVK